MNVILAHGCGEYPQKRIEEVNAYLLENGHTPFTRIPASDSEYVGGEKHLECDIYLAAFNYMQLEHLIAAVRSAQWNDPEQVQVFAKDEDEELFTEREWREHA